ncbi:MAG: glycosyltransferase WbuB, partial [Ruminococcus flavefaciens]|nr:glycosyltransferase WbuB [Ruminococcus flavefaciens]
AGKPMINTLASPEFCELVKKDRFGFTVEAENADKLAHSVLKFYKELSLCEMMGTNARRCAEEKFDRKITYRKIMEMIKAITK